MTTPPQGPPPGLPPTHWEGPGPHPGGYPPPYGGYPPPYPPQPPVDPVTAHPHQQPTPYHQMYRTWGYSWWRPVVGVLLIIVGFFIVAPIIAAPILLVGAFVEGSGDYLQRIQDFASFTIISVTGLLYVNVAIALLTPIVWFLVRVMHRLRHRWISSVRPGIRWRFLWVSLGMAFVTLIVTYVVSAFIPTSGDPAVGMNVNPFDTKMLLLILVVVFTTPLQAIGEEYAFRGYLLQAFGSLLKNQWFAILGSAVIFALAHGSQNFPLFFDRLAFGLVAAWLVIRTGGLEAGIAMHILNNILAFGSAILFGDVAASMDVQTISWWNIPVTLTQSILYAALILWMAKVMKIDRFTRPPVPVAAPEVSQH